MAKINYDGVLESAHFNSNGQLDWVRVYVRMGSVFTDHFIMSRQDFIEQLKQGKRYMLGERIVNMGGKFKVSQPVRLIQVNGQETIVVGDRRASQGELSGVPVI